MEPSREYIRFHIYTCYKLGFRARPDHEELVTVYGDLSPSFRIVARWIQHFSDGRESVEDEARAGRPRTSVTDRSVERAEALIVEHTTITLRFLALELSVSYGSAHAVIHAQDGSSTSWQQSRKNKGWQSAATGCNNLNQMALWGFLLLLRVTSVGFPSSLWRIKVLTWCEWPKMNHARRS